MAKAWPNSTKALRPFADAGDGREGEAEASRPFHLAIIGRPNVGKSTLLNRLLGQERVLTGPEPGITRDAIAVDWSWGGRAIRLFDTAGLRRRARIEAKLERLSAGDTLRAIRFADTAILVLDALQPLERQDLTIANLVAEEGRALVLALNKWDAVKDREAALKRVRERLETSLPQLHGIPVVPLSALAGSGVDPLMKAVLAAGRRLEQAGFHRYAQPLAGGDSGASPAAAGRRAPLAAALYHAGQHAPA